MIEVELPDGSIAEFPYGTPNDVIKGALQKRFAPPQTVAGGKSDRERSWGETGMDVLKSAGTGLVEGAVGLAGLPRDAGQWLGEQATYGIGRLMGQSPEQIAAQQGMAAQAMDATGTAAPSSQQIMGGVEKVTGPLPMPETTAGKYARTTGQMAAGALAGPGGVLRKVAMTVAPGVASEAAGQATEGTWAEPIARAAGAIAGGAAAAGRGNVGTRQMLKGVGNIDAAHAAVKAETNQMYQTLRNAGIKYDANGVQQSVNSVSALRIDPVLDPKASRLRDLFVQMSGGSPDFEDVDNLKQIATGILRSTADKRDKFFTGKILDELNQITDNGALVTNGTIPAGQAAALAKRAKDLARRNIIADQIDEMGRKAGYYVSGTESGARNQFASYLKSQKGKGLSEAERKAFDAVTRREGPMNAAHMLGSRFSMPTMGGGGFVLGGPVGAAAGLLGNLAVRKGMEMSTKKSVENAMKTVLAGKGRQAAASARDRVAKGDKRARIGLATQSGLISAQEPFLTDARGNQYPYSLLGVSNR
jgi:hypothetical protein